MLPEAAADCGLRVRALTQGASTAEPGSEAEGRTPAGSGAQGGKSPKAPESAEAPDRKAAPVARGAARTAERKGKAQGRRSGAPPADKKTAVRKRRKPNRRLRRGEVIPQATTPGASLCRRRGGRPPLRRGEPRVAGTFGPEAKPGDQPGSAAVLPQTTKRRKTHPSEDAAAVQPLNLKRKAIPRSALGNCSIFPNARTSSNGIY